MWIEVTRSADGGKGLAIQLCMSVLMTAIARSAIDTMSREGYGVLNNNCQSFVDWLAVSIGVESPKQMAEDDRRGFTPSFVDITS